ncbi:MAG: RNA 2',3'-cyclic phosphodiesterase [Calditrichia bacterium]|nr:RNA 2',3'-cyclic phosphodiesterase [Calditrichia bacterium]
MELSRCFVAIEISDELKTIIDNYIISLKQIAPEIKWIKAKNLHLTIKFLGEIPPDLLLKVQEELSGISNVVNPFKMSISDVGFFPNQFKPRVVWLGLQNDKNNSIFKLHEWIEEKLEPLGFEREKRRFSPHLTLGRIKFTGKYQDLTEYINQHKFQSYNFKILEVVLMRSLLKQSGAVYSQLKTYSLEN